MQDLNFDWAEDLIWEILNLGIWVAQYLWGLLPLQSDHSLGILEWFVISLLFGVFMFIKTYGDGIILDSIAQGVQQVKPHTKQFIRDVDKFTRTTTKKGKKRARKRNTR